MDFNLIFWYLEFESTLQVVDTVVVLVVVVVVVVAVASGRIHFAIVSLY